MENIKSHENQNQESLVSGIFVVLSWMKKYKWHFLVWICLFIYGYVTDLLLYPNAFFLKVLVHFLTHHVLLFYSLLFCLNKFSSKTGLNVALGILRFLVVMGGFIALRVFLNYEIFPVLDKWMGYALEKVNMKNLIIGGLFWLTEQSVRGIAFFIFTKLIKNERQLGIVQKENLLQQLEIQKKEEEEKRAKQIEASYKILETTMVNLIHETKTPLTLVINCLSSLEKKIGTYDELNLIKNSINKLNNDIANIFDIERVKKGISLYDHNQLCNLSELLADNISMFEFYSADGKTNIKKNIADDLVVKADPAAVNRVINNLIENAIKYSEPGSPISISLSNQGDKIISLSLEDEGVGIPEEELQHIFTPYYQLNKSKRNIQGMGLGLPMVKSIVDSIGGKISINNNEDGLPGVRVTVKLSAAANLLVQKRFAVEKNANYGFEDVVLSDIEIIDSLPNILVVEDHKGLNKHISQTLGEKFNVSFALNGQEALQKIKVKVPDLIISDVMMDVMDGFEMAKTISEDAELYHIPIIFLSARSTLADKLQGLNLGAIDYIEKPFATEELKVKVESFLLNKEKGHQVLYNFTYERMKREVQHKNLTSEIEQIAVNSFDRNCESFLLTAREKEIAKFVVEGLTAKAIAEKISRSENTVKNHVSSIYEKVGVNNKIELIKQLHS